MFTQNKKQQKAAKIVYLTLSFLLNASQQVYAIDPPPVFVEDTQKAIGFKPLRINIPSAPDSLIEIIDESKVGVKVAIIDSVFDSHSYTQNVLSVSTKNAFLGRDPQLMALQAEVDGGHHANHVSSIIHDKAPETMLRVIDIDNDPSVKSAVDHNARIIAAIDAAIKSKVDFINISLRISPDADRNRNGKISDGVRKAFYKARDAGIGIIKSAGNDSEVIGLTPYTKSLAELVEGMQGNMVLVAATAGANGQEILASLSNKAGAAYNYTIAAPGMNIQAYGAANKQVTRSGTSMAAPAVTGAASLLKKAYPALSAKEVLLAIRDTARKQTTTKAKFAPKEFGNGVLDLSAALKKVEEISRLKLLQLPQTK